VGSRQLTDVVIIQSTRLLALTFLIVAAQLLPVSKAEAGGVTLITHGFNSSIDGWIIGMATKIPGYKGFPGTNFSCYEIAITQNGQGQMVATPTLLAGVPPLFSDSGEIVIKLDWEALSNGSVPTTTISAAAANALMATNLIAQLGGRSLVELPLHFVGHSRGASVITELARILGGHGIWIDHVTTLDPHPVSLFGDPSMKNYANVLFADNYWQTLGNLFDPTGEAISGAYNRQLTDLSGGNTLNHSDVHLWYHGTVQLTTPASDTEATITSAERQAWWTPLENAGTNAGFLYSLLGRGDRLSTLEPAGPDNGRVRDGLNKVWDLGAGIGANRSSLPTNNGAWPNLLRLELAGTNYLEPGNPISVAFYHQFASSTSATANLEFYLDPDLNPYNTNQISIYSGTLQGTGTNNVALSSLNLPNTAGIPPGNYSILARISSADHSRFLYAPQPVTLATSRLPPLLLAARIETNRFTFTLAGSPGQTIVIQGSSNLVQWVTIQTNTMLGTTLQITDLSGLGSGQRYYRAVLMP
jgi:hypothetical protein